MNRRLGAGAPLASLVAATLFGLVVCPAAASTPAEKSTASALPVDGPLFVRIDSLLAVANHEGAHALILPRLERARAQSDSVVLTELLRRLGSSRAIQGDGVGGEMALREALTFAEARRDSTNLLPLLRWLGVSLGIQGERDEAIALYKRLREAARARNDDLHLAWSLVGLGWGADNEDRVEESIEFYRDARERFRELDDFQGEMWANNSLGSVLFRAGEFEGTAECHAQTIELARKSGRPSSDFFEASARSNLGSLLFSLGRPDAAMEHFAEAARIHERNAYERERVVPLISHARCLGELGRIREARTVLEGELEYCRERNYRDLLGWIHWYLGQLEEQAGTAQRAAAHYRTCLDLGEATDAVPRRGCLSGLSDLLAAAGESDEALAIVAATAAGADQQAPEESLLGLRETYARRLREAGRHDEALDLVLAVERDARELGFAGRRVSAIALAARCERALGRNRAARERAAEAVAIWELDRELPLDPQWREVRARAAGRAFTDLASWNIEDNGRAGVIAAFDHLQHYKARTLLERIGGPGDHVAGSAPRTVDLAELRGSVLGPDELLLDFHGGESSTWLFAVTRETIRCVRLPGMRELGPRLCRLHGLLSDPGALDLGDTPRRFAELLLGDASDLIHTARTVFVSPDGPMNLLPLLNLPDSASPDGAPFLEDRSWVWLPSATALANRRRASADDAVPGRVLAVAVTRGREGLLLPGTKREVLALGRSYTNVDVHVGEPLAMPLDADRLAPYAVLHFATHVRGDDGTPWQSEIVLDPSGPLSPRASDIASMKLPARLVFLSGCSTAGGRVLTGEGVTGLSSAFLAAGVPTVVATLWDVDDRVTARLVRHFYEQLAAGSNAAAALRHAQLAVRADRSTEHPFFWAGFVLIGDGDLMVPLRRRWFRWPFRGEG